jgi:hypothetical protein
MGYQRSRVVGSAIAIDRRGRRTRPADGIARPGSGCRVRRLARTCRAGPCPQLRMCRRLCRGPARHGRSIARDQRASAGICLSRCIGSWRPGERRSAPLRRPIYWLRCVDILLLKLRRLVYRLRAVAIRLLKLRGPSGYRRSVRAVYGQGVVGHGLRPRACDSLSLPAALGQQRRPLR